MSYSECKERGHHSVVDFALTEGENLEGSEVILICDDCGAEARGSVEFGEPQIEEGPDGEERVV